MGKSDCKQGNIKGFQIGTKRFQIGEEITNWGKRDYKPGQGFQIEAGITDRCRTCYSNKYKKYVACSYGYKLVCVDDNFSKSYKSYLSEEVVYNFINSMIKE